MKNIPNNSRFYFDHSYYTEIDENNKLEYGDTNHGINFKSLFDSKKNIYGCQPHPEKAKNLAIQMLQELLCKL